MKCYACEKELSKKELLFTEDKTPYCENPFTCAHPNHPNSVENIVARSGAIKLYTEDELEKTAFDRLNVSPEIRERIEKIANKPQSIRLNRVDIAHYLIQLQDVLGLSSLSDAVRHSIQVAMEHRPIDAADLKLELPEDDTPPIDAHNEINISDFKTGDVSLEPPKTKPIIKFEVPETPKKQAVPEKEEEETFTF